MKYQFRLLFLVPLPLFGLTCSIIGTDLARELTAPRSYVNRGVPHPVRCTRYSPTDGGDSESVNSNSQISNYLAALHRHAPRGRTQQVDRFNITRHGLKLQRRTQ